MSVSPAASNVPATSAGDLSTEIRDSALLLGMLLLVLGVATGVGSALLLLG